MFSVVRAAAIAVLCLLAAACSRQQLLEKFSSPEDRALSEQTIKALKTGDDAFIIAHLHPELRAQMPDQLPKMRGAMISGPGVTMSQVDARFTASQTTGGPPTRRAYLAYELDRGGQHVLVRLGLYREGGGPAQITDLWVNVLDKPIEELTGFSLSGKSPLQYGVLVLSVLSFLTILAALVTLIRVKGPKPKWLWVIASLIGFGQFAVDWNSGQLGFQLLNVQLFGAFAMKSGMFEPWRVGFGVPLFAILVLVRAIRARGGPKAAAGQLSLGDDEAPPAG